MDLRLTHPSRDVISPRGAGDLSKEASTLGLGARVQPYNMTPFQNDRVITSIRAQVWLGSVRARNSEGVAPCYLIV